MALVESGSFNMGNDSGVNNEKPAHKVVLTGSFYMSKYEITYDQYDSFCDETKRYKKPDKGWGRGKRPAIYVSLYDAIAFCNWLSRKNGLVPCYFKQNNKWTCNFNADGFRLPTEAEWEYAAKGGAKSRGYVYSGSNDPGEAAWYRDNSNGMTHPVGEKKPNELGLFDMSGNAAEWCWDGFEGDFYKKSPEADPVAKSYWMTVKRGGSWKGSALSLTNTFRNSDYPLPDIADEIGFRVVRNKDK